MIGKKLRQFEILDKIGSGGMGDVFLALDHRLGRKVALKVVPEATAEDPHRLARFQAEARTLASLNHPNIVTIHAVDAVDSVHFLALELVVGQTLDRLLPEGGLPLSKLLRISLPLVDAIASAHAHGIVHRDIKPRNIMVTEEDRVKVLDFGLAKTDSAILPPNDDSDTVALTATRVGTVTGTVPYMAPEQLQGLPISPASDVFSLGAVLFEMATGRRPWAGSNPVDLAVSILRDPAPPLGVPKQGYGDELQTILHRCLAKDPAKRYPSARQLHGALSQLESSWMSETFEDTKIMRVARRAKVPRLRHILGGLAAGLLVIVLGFGFWPDRQPSPAAVGATATAETRPMIVVLPFRNLGSPEDAYFTAGVSEEVMSRLARVDGLGVISRTSALKYAETSKSSRQIGDELGVDYILSGTVRWSKGRQGTADRVRVTPQLVRVADDSQLWSNSYDKVLEDIFQVQSELALQVIEQLGVNILPGEQAAIERLPTARPQAAQAFRRGQEFERNPDYTPEKAEQARREYAKATEIDPEFLLAWSNLSRVHAQMIHFGHDRSPERHRLAKEAVDRARALDPGSPEVSLATGYYHYWANKDYSAARQAFLEAAQEHPDRAEALAALAYVDRRLGSFQSSLEGLEKALTLDPRNPTLAREIGNTYIFLGQAARARHYLDRAIALAPNATHTYLTKVDAIWRLEGDLPAARRVLEGLPPEDHPLRAWCLFWQAIYEGTPRQALDILEGLNGDTLKWNVHWQPVALLEAQAHQLLGDHTGAREAYQRSLNVLDESASDAAADPRRLSARALTLAGLGRHDEAVATARRAVELLPTRQDALFGPPRQIDLALVYVTVGDLDAAMGEIEDLLQRPGQLTPALLRLDPRWRPLEVHAGFEDLSAEN